MEEEIRALACSRKHRDQLKELMAKKEAIGDLLNHLRQHQQHTLQNNAAVSAPLQAAAAGNILGGRAADAIGPASGGQTCPTTMTGAIGARTFEGALNGPMTLPIAPTPASLADSARHGPTAWPVGQSTSVAGEGGRVNLDEAVVQLLAVMQHLDAEIEPMLEADGSIFNQR